MATLWLATCSVSCRKTSRTARSSSACTWSKWLLRSTTLSGSTYTVALPRGTAHLPAERVGAARTRPSTAVSAAAFVEEAVRWLPDEIAVDASPVGDGVVTEGARVLLVDDNADMRAYLQRLLAPHWAVEVAADGEDALDKVRARPPELVVTDAMMPNLDGYGLLRALRADPRQRGRRPGGSHRGRRSRGRGLARRARGRGPGRLGHGIGNLR